MKSISPADAATILNVQGMTGTPSYTVDENGVTWNFPGASLTQPAQLRIADVLERHIIGVDVIKQETIDRWIVTNDPEQISRDEAEAEINEQLGLATRMVLAVAYLTLREINLLREENGWAPRTERQFWQAIKAEIQDPHFEVPD